MSERESYLLEYFSNFKSNDSTLRLKDFDSLNQSLYDLIKGLYSKEFHFNYHHKELNNKYFRYGLTCQSMRSLMNGNMMYIKSEVNTVDLTSICCLTRMQIETFAVMYYLFFDKVDSDLKDFRFDIYKLHGLIKHYEFPLKKPEHSGRKQILEREILGLKEKIEQNTFFVESNHKKQLEYLKPSFAKLISTKDILIKSGIEKLRLNQMWSLYSNYAHNEYISDRQFYDIYKNKEEPFSAINLLITINSILTAKLCFLLKDEFKPLAAIYDEFILKDRVQIEIWSKLSTI